VGPFRNGMARPQVGNRGKVSIWRVAANILNKQSRTADKWWSSGLGFGRRSNNTSPYKLTLLRKGHSCFRTGLIFWYNPSNGKGTSGLVHGM